MLAQPLADFLAALGHRRPAPGGGCAAAVAATLAAATARKVAAYSEPAEQEAAPAGLMGELERLEAMAGRFADEDAAAYAAYAAARAAKAPPADVQAALQLAAEVPQELLATALTLLRRLDEHKAHMNPRLLSDLAVAAHLAHAACNAAGENVRVNAAAMNNAGERAALEGQCRAWLTQADGLWRSIVSFAHADGRFDAR